MDSNLNEEKIKALKALIEKPSTYEIEVLDNSMLPLELKENKTIKLTIKPPSVGTLARCTIDLLNIPDEIRKGSSTDLSEYMNSLDDMVNVLVSAIHNSSSEVVEWYFDFIKNNLEPKEIYELFRETELKLQTDFFLSSFQIASRGNPMMMEIATTDLTPTNS